MRFAARETAVFNQPEVALGIIPGGSGTQRLARLVGRSRALEIVLGCDDVDAELAERWGWVNRALPAEELWPFVDRLATRIASFPPHAVAAAKASVLRAEKEVVADLLAEGAAFNRTLGRSRTRETMERFPHIRWSNRRRRATARGVGGTARTADLEVGQCVEEKRRQVVGWSRGRGGPWASTSHSGRDDAPVEQVPAVRYVRSDGVNIAYTRWGQGSHVLVYTPPLASNVELFWESAGVDAHDANTPASSASA
jgi:hypothetical protein